MIRLLPFLLCACTAAAPVSATATSSRATSSSADAAPAYTSPEHPRCVARGALPDPACTPGAVETTDLAVICGKSTRERRAVSEATRRAALASYGVRWEDRGGYEVDHLVALELGGSNAIENLWPEPRGGVNGAEEKDKAENAAHRRVCAGTSTIENVQRAFMLDWRMMR